MSIKTECQAVIHSYISAETQINASLTGEHKEYVLVVLQLLRDEYHHQVEQGNTSFDFDVNGVIAKTLNEMSPW